MPTNQEIWGAESDWVARENYTGTNRKNMLLTGNFGDGYYIGSVLYQKGCLQTGYYRDKLPTYKQLQDGSALIDEPLDNSISYCGLGNESIYSKLAYLEYKNSMLDGDFTKQDDRSVTNFAFCISQGSASGFSVSNDTSQTAARWRGSECRISPLGYNAPYDTLSRANKNREVEPYVSIPVRNFILTPVVLATNAINTTTPNSTSGMDIVSFDWWDYMDTTKPKNYTTHPYILMIGMHAYVSTDVDNINAVTGVPQTARTSSTTSHATLSGIAVLSPLTVCDDEPMDIANPTQIITDTYSYYLTRCKKATPASQGSSIPLFGFTHVGGNDTNYIRMPNSNGVSSSSERYVFFPHPNAQLVKVTNSNPNNYSQSGWYYLEYYNGLFDWIIEQIACFGLFFTFDKDTAQTGALNDPLMYLGVLDANGIGHGDYSTGKDNEDQPQWEWDTTNKSSYKPSEGGGGGDRPRPDPGANAKGLHTPGFSLAVDNGSVNYIINQAEWGQIWDDIYGGSKNDWEELINGLSLYGSNPLNAILNYRWYPFEFGAGTAEQLRLGASLVGPVTHKYNVITAAAQGFKSKTASFWCGDYAGFEKDFVNIRKSKCRVWLPFYGFYELPMTMVINHTVNITFQYSIPDDMGVWEIAFGNSMWDFVECQPFIEIPITGDNSLQIAAAKAQRNLSIAMTIGAAIAGAAIGGAAGLAKGVIASGFGTAADIAESGILGTASALWGNASYGELAMGLGGAAIGVAAPLAGGGIKAANTVMQSALQTGNLSTNLPTHTGASDTTFLNLSLTPFIEFYIPIMQDDYNANDYKKTTGIACDKWVSLDNIGDKLSSDSLLQTTGISDMDTSGMELDEINELNSIVQSGFWL